MWSGRGGEYKCKYFVRKVLFSNDSNIKFQHLFQGASYREVDIFSISRYCLRNNVTDAAVASV